MDFPKSVEGVGLVNGKFVDENTATGQVGSLIPASWGNAVTEEIINLQKEFSQTPKENKNTQLTDAMKVAVVRTDKATSLSTQQKKQARNNVDALCESETIATLDKLIKENGGA